MDEDADFRMAVELSLSGDPTKDFLSQPNGPSLLPQASSSNVSQIRTPASSIAAKRAPAPKMTRQMSDAWMRQYNDNTARPCSQPKGSRRAFVDLSIIRWFTLVYWDQVCRITVHLISFKLTFL